MSASDETFKLILGAHAWDLPHFPFGLIRKLQPRLLRLNREMMAKEKLADALDEDALETLLDIVASAVAFVHPGITRETLDSLQFSTGDLISAQKAVMQACGLKPAAPAGGETAGDPKAEPTSTTS